MYAKAQVTTRTANDKRLRPTLKHYRQLKPQEKNERGERNEMNERIDMKIPDKKNQRISPEDATGYGS
jgi:uncharacterized protein with gpF-like domain